MAKVAVYNMEGKEVDSIELNDSIFGVEINEHLVHMAVLQGKRGHFHLHQNLGKPVSDRRNRRKESGTAWNRLHRSDVYPSACR